MSELDVGQIAGRLKLGLTDWSGNIDKAIADMMRASTVLDQELVATSKQATATLSTLAKELGATAAAVGRLESAVAKGSADAVGGMNQLGQAIGRVEGHVSGLDESLGRIIRELRGVRDDARLVGDVTSRAFMDMAKSVNRALDDTKRLNEAQEKSQPAVSQLGASFRTLAGVLGIMSPTLGRVTSGLYAIENAAKATGLSMGAAVPLIAAAAAALGTLHAAFSFTLEGLKLSGELEQTSKAFEVIIGNATEARKVLAELKQFSANSTYKFETLVDAGRQLLAMQVPAKDLMSTMRMLADIASGLKQPLGEIAYLYGQIKSQGLANAVDLRQFAQRGIPIYRELAAVMKINVEQVKDYVTAGRIGFPEVEAAFRRMTAQGGQFFEMQKQQATTLPGEVAKLTAAWESAKLAAGDAFNSTAGKKILDELRKGIEDLKPAIRDAALAVADAMRLVLPALRETLNTVKAIMDATGLSDRFKGATAAAPDQSGALGRLQRTPGGAASLATVRSSMVSVNDQSIAALNQIYASEMGLSRPLANRIYTLLEDYRGRYQDAKKDSDEIAKLAADSAAGKSIDAAAWDRLIKNTSAFMAKTNELSRAVRDAASETSQYGNGGVLDVSNEGAINRVASQALPGLNSAYATAQAILTPLQRQMEAAAQRSQPSASPTTIAASGSTSAASSGIVAETPGVPLTPRQAAAKAARDQKKEEREAEREADAAADSAERARTALSEAKVASLRTAGKELDADIAETTEKFRRQILRAPTADEKNALIKQRDAELAELRKKADDEAKKKKLQADEELAKETKKQLDALRDSIVRAADYELQSQLVLLRSYGREFDATLLEIEQRFRERMRRAITDGEREMARRLRDSEVTAANKQKADADAKSGKVDRGPIFDAKQRIQSSTGSARALAELDLREATRGGLNAADRARQARLRKMMGLGPDGKPRADGTQDPEADARERMKNAKTPSERALAQLDLREAVGNKLTPSEMTRRDRLRAATGYVARAANPFESDPSATPSNAARGAVEQAAGSRPASPGNAGPGNVSASVNVDENKLARALVGLLEPKIDQKLQAMESRIKAERFGTNAGRGY